jgi:hypothetical protein
MTGKSQGSRAFLAICLARLVSNDNKLKACALCSSPFQNKVGVVPLPVTLMVGNRGVL